MRAGGYASACEPEGGFLVSVCARVIVAAVIDLSVIVACSRYADILVRLVALA